MNVLVYFSVILFTKLQYRLEKDILVKGDMYTSAPVLKIQGQNLPRFRVPCLTHNLGRMTRNSLKEWEFNLGFCVSLTNSDTNSGSEFSISVRPQVAQIRVNKSYIELDNVSCMLLTIGHSLQTKTCCYVTYGLEPLC